MGKVNVIKKAISINKILKKAKKSKDATKCGMFLFHNGVVRETSKAKVRQGKKDTKRVKAMEFSFDKKKVDAAIKKAMKLKGIYYVEVYLNKGILRVGDDIMYVVIGGDIRPNVINALNSLVGELKTNCVIEKEIV